MPLQDIFDKAEESVARYPLQLGKETVQVYELKLSNAEPVLKQCLEFIVNDSRSFRSFLLVFNAKHVNSRQTNLYKIAKVLDEYKQLLFSKKLVRFAIVVKSFISHRRVIDLFDRLFDENGFSRSKYTYFSEKHKDRIEPWLVRGEKS